MAHEFETGMFLRNPAWHGLGNVLPEAPSVADAIVYAGLDWTVEEEPIYRATDNPAAPVAEIPSHKHLYRSTDRQSLGVVGAAYRPLQNAKAFGFFESFVGSREAEIEAAGSLRNGKRVWILARLLGHEADVFPGDPVYPYLLLYNGHDGTLAVSVAFTPVRVVCANTLSMADSEAERRGGIVRIRHTSRVEDAVLAVRESVDLSARSFSVTMEAYRSLARTRMGVSGLRQYVREVWQVPESAREMPRAWESIERLFEAGRGSGLSRGTAWGAYNAVTEWTAYERGRSATTRLDSNWFGEGARLRERALECAIALTR